MAPTFRSGPAARESIAPSPPAAIMRSPLVETLRPRNGEAATRMCPELLLMVSRAREHYASLGSESMFLHATKVLQAAVRGRLISQSREGLDPFSRQVAELILYHPIESDKYLPNSGLGAGFAGRFSLQLQLKRLDCGEGDRLAQYVRLFNDPSTDHSGLLVALYTRIADMMTIQDEATAEAARVRIPGVFPMHEDWEAVKASWAEPMLRIYCPIADWGGQTTAYREMRDNAMYYLHPDAFVRVAAEVQGMMGALANTTSMLYSALEGMAERFGLRMLVGYDLPTVSAALPRLDAKTIAVAVRPFKGVGGLLDKSMRKGIPVGMVHDCSGATVITGDEDLMYALSGYLYSGGIASAARQHGVSELFTIPPKDYAQSPKPVTLYQSVHLDTVSSDPRMLPMELIVRTSQMHRKADEGTAGHDVYKLSPLVNGERARFMERLGQISSGY